MYSIYSEFKKFGFYPITEKANNFNFNTGEFEYPKVENCFAKKMLNMVWAGYRELTGFELINLTHEGNNPWKRVYKEKERFTVIEKKNIEEYFKQKLEEIKNS